MQVITFLFIAVATCVSVASLYLMLKLYKMFRGAQNLQSTYRSEVLTMMNHIKTLDDVKEYIKLKESDVTKKRIQYETLISRHEEILKDVNKERENVLNCTNSVKCSISRKENEPLRMSKKRLASKLGYTLINELPLLEDNSSLSITVPILNPTKAFDGCVNDILPVEDEKCEEKE